MNWRTLTSHEQMAGRPWDASYHDDAPAPWDLGRPQEAVVRLAAKGAFEGAVLDAGCGTGENALHIAGLGLAVFGFDVAETAIAMARQKAIELNLDAEFVVADAFQLETLNRKFQTVLDCGLFHAFDDDERARYATSLGSVTSPGGTVYVLCFSDRGSDRGPHPVSEEQLHAAFSNGWMVAAIAPERIETRFHENGASGWLATIQRH